MAATGADVRLARLLELAVRLLLYANRRHLAIVFAGTLTATVLALLLSFFAARNIMRGVVLGTLALLMRRLFDVLRGIDMAIWGLILYAR